MRIRGDSGLALAVIAIGFAPALIKKSKPLSRYVGDQLIKMGDYLKAGSEEPVKPPAESPTPAEEVSHAVVEDPISTDVIDGEIVTEDVETADPVIEPATDEEGEGESHKAWD